MPSRLIFAGMAALAAQSASAQTGAAPPSPWQPSLLGPAEFRASLPPRAVLSAIAFGARPDDNRDDSRAIQAALTGARASGAAAVFLPAGQYLIATEVRMPPGVALLGESCARTRITRSPALASQMLFRLDGARNVRIQGIGFDHNGAPPYTRSVGFRGAGSNDVTIIDNCFDDSRVAPGADPAGSGDRWAIELSAEASPSSRLWIGRNRSDGGMQLTAGGGAGVHILRIVDNDVRNGRNAGIAVSHQGNAASFRDLLIARNRIEQSLGLGIYVGPDAAGGRGGRFQDVAITDNIIRGFRGRYPHGIYLRADDAGSNAITIARNVLDGGGRNDSSAVRLEDNHGNGARRFANLLIADNIAEGFERGFWLDHVNGALLQRNRASGPRGFQIAGETNRNVRVED